MKIDHPLINIAFNILIPVAILNKLSSSIGSLNALILALFFPLVYGALDFFKNHKFNWIAFLGVINVAFTGGFALIGLSGIWFAVKEASFPFLIGLFVLGSSFSQSPFIKSLILNPQAINLHTLESALEKHQSKVAFSNLLKKSTLWLSGSFMLSAALNFGLAYSIFDPLPLGINEEERGLILNEQIAQMTKWSFPVILLPSLIFLGLILFYLIREIRKLTGLKFEDIVKSDNH